MKVRIEISGGSYTADLGKPIDLAIPQQFNHAQPRFFGAPRASARPYRAGSFIGDTRQGGSCNVAEVQLIPHCNGTHTEGIGHLALQRITLPQILRNHFFPATLITVQPLVAEQTDETYSPPLRPGQQVITGQELNNVLADCAEAFLQALVVRTLPNPPDKCQRDYGQAPAPFFTLEAMQLIREREIMHLLVDLPSVDCADDQGQMCAHRLFWDVPSGSHQVDPSNPSLRTITEMIYVPDVIADGIYLLELQTAPFVSDAAPSRPIFYALHEGG